MKEFVISEAKVETAVLVGLIHHLATVLNCLFQSILGSGSICSQGIAQGLIQHIAGEVVGAALSGVGNVAAKAIAEVVDKNNPFISQEDLRQRAGIGKAVTERLGEIGALGDLPDSNQMDLFADFM